MHNLMNLLQINIKVASDSTTTVATKVITVWTLLTKGGWTMIPIVLLSILALYILIDRIIAIYTRAKMPPEWIDELKQKAARQDLEGMATCCLNKKYAVARVIRAGVQQRLSPTTITIEDAMKSAAQVEVYALEKNLWLLGTIAGAAPMLGFLGTVLGMIQAFMAMAQTTGQVSPQLLSGGIYQAMVTTAAGLIVGIIAYVGYNYILTKIQQAAQRIEHTSNQFLDIIRGLAGKSA